MAKPTGRQRLLAAALGIRGVDRMTREELSSAIDKEKDRRQSPPNKEQLRTAALWGIDMSSTRTAGGASGQLWDAALARVYALSVLRRICDARWRYHSECPVPESWINRVAIELFQDGTRTDAVLEMDNAMSGTAGDAWFRFGKRQAEAAPFTFVEQAARRELDVVELAKASHQTSHKVAKKQQGCLTVVSVLIALMLCLCVAII